MSFLEKTYGYKPRCVLIVSTGGGGDVATALLYSEIVLREGSRAVVAVLPWDRYVKDPCPGPVEIESMTDVQRLDYVAVPGENCVAVRCGRVFTPTACKAAIAAKKAPTIYILDGWGGELAVRLGIREAASIHGCDAVLSVDVGGDVLAHGCEPSLWSPLGDALGLSAVANLSTDSALVVQGLGADGELDEDELLSIVASLASKGALIWSRGLTRDEAVFLSNVTRVIHTEAGRIPLMALQGYYGPYSIRDGTRRVMVNIYKSCGFILEPRAVYEESLPARLVTGTDSLEAARRRLNDAGIYTELDLEIDIHRLIELGILSPEKVIEARKRGRLSLPGCSYTTH